MLRRFQTNPQFGDIYNILGVTDGVRRCDKFQPLLVSLYDMQQLNMIGSSVHIKMCAALEIEKLFALVKHQKGSYTLKPCIRYVDHDSVYFTSVNM